MALLDAATAANQMPLPVNPTTTARHKMLLWARRTVKKEVESEMKMLSTDPRLRLPTSEQTWATISDFSLHALGDCAKLVAPTLYKLLVAAGAPRRRNSKGAVRAVRTARKRDSELASMFQACGVKRTDPQMILCDLQIATTAILMINRSQNSQANRFQKIFGVWFFFSSAPSNIYRVACRLGLSVGYTTMINTLTQLAQSSVESTRDIASSCRRQNSVF